MVENLFQFLLMRIWLVINLENFHQLGHFKGHSTADKKVEVKKHK